MRRTEHQIGSLIGFYRPVNLESHIGAIRKRSLIENIKSTNQNHYLHISLDGTRNMTRIVSFKRMEHTLLQRGFVQALYIRVYCIIIIII